MNPNATPAAPSISNPVILATSLNSRSFAPFGHVIQNPTHSASHAPQHLQKITANQGTATKWLDVTDMTSWYSAGNAPAPSGKPARVAVNMFVCKARELEERDLFGGSGRTKVFPVRILERHPYTAQTFVPMGVEKDDQETRYLVIVAPTLKTSAAGERGRPKPYPAEKPKLGGGKTLRERLFGARPNLYTNDHAATTTSGNATEGESQMQPKGFGEPDLDNLQAFIARGDQAVTYGPGTWHAPMVVLGKKEIDFVVVQFANGVGLEDCQEYDVKDDIVVDVDESGVEASGPGIMRAKL